MKKNLSIIKDDNMTVIDGVGIDNLDLSSIPDNVHAIQWSEDDKTGEIEYRASRCSHCNVLSKKPNEMFSDLSPYAGIIVAHEAKLEEFAAEQAALEAKVQEEEAAREVARNAAPSDHLDGNVHVEQ
jgi:hypothetical protein